MFSVKFVFLFSLFIELPINSVQNTTTNNYQTSPTTGMSTGGQSQFSTTEQPISSNNSQPVSQSTASPVSQSTASPVSQSTASSVSQSTASPVSQSTVSPVSQSTASPVSQSTASPVSQSTVSPGIEHQICVNQNLVVDSILSPIGRDFAYLITNNLLYKLDIKDENKSIIQWEKGLDFWSPDIKAPIDFIYTDDVYPMYIKLVNCELQTEYYVNYTFDYYFGNKESQLCIISQTYTTIEFLIDDSNNPYFLEEWYKLEYKTFNPITYQVFQLRKKIQSNSSTMIRLIDENDSNEMKLSEPFNQLNGSPIKAGYIKGKNWYLFGGRYFCKVLLNPNTYEECNPRLFTEWIDDCKGQTLPSIATTEVQPTTSSPPNTPTTEYPVPSTNPSSEDTVSSSIFTTSEPLSPSTTPTGEQPLSTSDDSDDESSESEGNETLLIVAIVAITLITTLILISVGILLYKDVIKKDKPDST